jgi:hypothetical protein
MVKSSTDVWHLCEDIYRSVQGLHDRIGRLEGAVHKAQSPARANDVLEDLAQRVVAQEKAVRDLDALIQEAIALHRRRVWGGLAGPISYPR